MTTPRNRRPTRAQPAPPQRPHLGWGYGNTNAQRRPEQLVLYRATELLYALLERGPVLRCRAIAYMRQQGIGINTALSAAALIGVPPVPASNTRGEWTFPHPIPHLPAVLQLITEHGRHVGRRARHERGLFINDPAARDWPWEGWVKSKNECER
jgi:hypothetical protein